jgi:translation initiation factor 1
MNSALRSLLTAAAAVCLGAAAVHAQEASGRPTEPSAIEFSPVSPFIRIYAAQYARRLTDKNELIIGGGYTNIKYDDGQSHAPTFIIGCRRYIWKKAHADEPVPSRVVAKLRIEKSGRGGKTVTVVYDLPRNQAFLRDVAGELKRACGTGGAVVDDTVELQGDVRDRLRPLLAKKGWTIKG